METQQYNQSVSNSPRGLISRWCQSVPNTGTLSTSRPHKPVRVVSKRRNKSRAGRGEGERSSLEQKEGKRIPGQGLEPREQEVRHAALRSSVLVCAGPSQLNMAWGEEQKG